MEVRVASLRRIEMRSDGRLDVGWRRGSMAGRGIACAKALWCEGQATERRTV